MSWGKGGMVGVHKAIWQHERAISQAEIILEEEHGIQHKEGEHNLCPKCREFREQTKGEMRTVACYYHSKIFVWVSRWKRAHWEQCPMCHRWAYRWEFDWSQTKEKE